MLASNCARACRAHNVILTLCRYQAIDFQFVWQISDFLFQIMTSNCWISSISYRNTFWTGVVGSLDFYGLFFLF